MIRCIYLTLAVAVSMLTSSVALATSLLGNDLDGRLWDVDPATGAVSNFRSTAGSLMGIAVSSNGTIFGLTTFLGSPGNALVTIDPVTGAPSTVGSTGLFRLYEGDLDFDPTTGMLYGVQNQPSYPDVELFTIDPATGAGTSIGVVPANLGDLSAMAFASDGTLLVLDTYNDELLTLDKSDASILSSVGLSLDLGPVAGMDFHPVTGDLYVADGEGGTNSLYTLDVSTGNLSLIGATGVGTSGLAGLAFVVPEASDLALLGSSLTALAMLGRRRAPREARG